RTRCERNSRSLCFMELVCTSFANTIANRRQCALKGLPRHGFHKPFNQPSKAERDGTAEADGFALDDNAAVLFSKSPIRIQAPQEAAIVPNGFLHFRRASSVLDFGDPCRKAAARLLSRLVMPVDNCVIRVVVHGYDLLAHKAKEDLEGVTIARQTLRLF